MSKVRQCLTMIPAFALLLAPVACQKRQRSGLKDESSPFKLSYNILGITQDERGGVQYRAQVTVRPGLGQGWSLEFDFPHEIWAIKGARMVSKTDSGHYVISEDPDLTSAETSYPSENLPESTTSPQIDTNQTPNIPQSGNTSYRVTQTWTGGYLMVVNIPAAKNWTLDFDSKFEIVTIWNGKILRHDGHHYQIGPVDYDSTEIGFTVKGDEASKELENIRFSVLASAPMRLSGRSPLALTDTSGDQETSFEITAFGTRPESAQPTHPVFHSTRQISPGNTRQENPTKQGPARTGTSCVLQNFGISKDPVVGPELSYQARAASLADLPLLTTASSNADVKRFVSQVYDQFPVFKQIYEDSLKLTREQALAFMYGDMSKESAQNHPKTGKMVWYIELETAMQPADNSAHAYGPFQAAVTNFTGGGYDRDILNQTGLPTPKISDFKNPSIVTFAGMKRLAEGIIATRKEFGPNHEASLYLLGTLAHHNTGWAKSAENEEWKKDYGNEVFRLMQGYLVGENMVNDTVFWTRQPEDQICR